MSPTPTTAITMNTNTPMVSDWPFISSQEQKQDQEYCEKGDCDLHKQVGCKRQHKRDGVRQLQQGRVALDGSMLARDDANCEHQENKCSELPNAGTDVLEEVLNGPLDEAHV